jgi:protein-arginine deiminase
MLLVAAFIAVFLVACGGGGGGGGGSGVGGGGGGSSPIAGFSATPTATTVGTPVQFTDSSTGATGWEWDFNSDGTPEEYAQNPSYAYAATGTYDVTLKVTNAAGNNVLTRYAYVVVSTTAQVVDLDADTDRNGVVDASDETGEDAWSSSRGAIFYLNIDDDDSNNQFDSSDAVVANAADAQDLSSVWLRRMASAPAAGTVTVSVTPAAAQGSIRIFQNNAGTWTSVYNTGASFTLPIASLQAADIELGIECNTRLSPTWDGVVFLTLDVKDASAVSLGTDQVRLRCAPPIMVNNMWKTDKYYIVSVPSGTDNNTAARTVIQGVCNTNGITYGEVPGASYSYDRWLQDGSEPMCVQLPSASGVRRVDSTLQLARYRPSDGWCQNILWDPEFDFIQRFASSQGSHNYGGNLEVCPPFNNATGNYPWGRIVTGGGQTTLIGTTSTNNESMDTLYKQFFTACGLQGPSVEIDSSWLAVGHVDEFLSFVPAPNTARGWAVVIASPTLGRQILLNVQAAGGGALAVFAGRSTNGWATTVNAALANTALTSFNAGAQTKIDNIKQQLITQLGLTAADFIEVPVMFENVGSNYAAAFNPGVANLVCMPTATKILMIVPDPEGPDQPTDAWQKATRTALLALGTATTPVEVTFVDVFYSYHDLLGEIHCGSQNVRTPPATPWWQ